MFVWTTTEHHDLDVLNRSSTKRSVLSSLFQLFGCNQSILPVSESCKVGQTLTLSRRRCARKWWWKKVLDFLFVSSGPQPVHTSILTNKVIILLLRLWHFYYALFVFIGSSSVQRSIKQSKGTSWQITYSNEDSPEVSNAGICYLETQVRHQPQPRDHDSLKTKT